MHDSLLYTVPVLHPAALPKCVMALGVLDFVVCYGVNLVH